MSAGLYMCLNERADSWILGIDSSDLRRFEPSHAQYYQGHMNLTGFGFNASDSSVVRAANLQIKNSKNISSQHFFLQQSPQVIPSTATLKYLII